MRRRLKRIHEGHRKKKLKESKEARDDVRDSAKKKDTNKVGSEKHGSGVGSLRASPIDGRWTLGATCIWPTMDVFCTIGSGNRHFGSLVVQPWCGDRPTHSVVLLLLCAVKIRLLRFEVEEFRHHSDGISTEGTWRRTDTFMRALSGIFTQDSFKKYVH